MEAKSPGKLTIHGAASISRWRKPFARARTRARASKVSRPLSSSGRQSWRIARDPNDFMGNGAGRRRRRAASRTCQRLPIGVTRPTG